MQHRVVITGLGVLAPNGIGKETFWQACLAGQSGIRKITHFDASQHPSQIAGEVQGFDPVQAGLTPTEIRTLDRGTMLGIAASNLALEDAGLLDLDETERARIGVYMGTAMASVEEGEQQWLRLTNNFADPPTAHDDAPGTLLLTHSASAAIATHHRLHGACEVIATGCSAGADAIGLAYWEIQEGHASVMLAGGTDSAICNLGLRAFSIMGALSTRNDDPARASRPYDLQRDGFVMSEGAGILLLEAREHALARNAHIYAEIHSFTSNINAYHMTALPDNGAPLKQLLLQTLTEAALAPAQLDYINSHGSSTRSNERAETAAYKEAFGPWAYQIPISATKSMIGHSQGAASAIEAIVTALVVERQQIPPTINQEEPDPACDLDYVPNTSRAANVQVALTHSSGFGGINSALIFTSPDWQAAQPAV
ncbi:MAG TPA: beta-ketoacyl-[acyl-carrier-protein] synthase family protein [Ktedonobacteraceae bacterium]|nr:beta-ketoacyl-[acyl-carrier-protein] synthase family protein [Ktedonobacteraceae bacterium]